MGMTLDDLEKLIDKKVGQKIDDAKKMEELTKLTASYWKRNKQSLINGFVVGFASCGLIFMIIILIRMGG